MKFKEEVANNYCWQCNRVCCNHYPCTDWRTIIRTILHWYKWGIAGSIAAIKCAWSYYNACMSLINFNTLHDCWYNCSHVTMYVHPLGLEMLSNLLGIMGEKINIFTMIPWMAVNTTCTFSMEWGSRPCGCHISALSVVIVALLGTHWLVKLISL